MRDLPFLAGEQGRGPLLVVLFFISVTVVIMWGSWLGTMPAGDEVVMAEMGREIARGEGVWPSDPSGGGVMGTAPAAPWLMALFFRFLPVHVFTARLPFMLLSVGTLILTFIAGKKGKRSGARGETWIDPAHATGLLSAVILALSVLFGKFTITVTNMAPFAFFTILATVGWLDLPENRRGLVSWTLGLAGAVLSAGPGGLLLIPGAAAAAVFDTARRKNLKDPIFLGLTLIAAAGVSWLLAGAWPGERGDAVPGSLWALFRWDLASFAVVIAALAVSVRDVWLGTLPWSIPSTVAVARGLIPSIRKREGSGLEPLDWAVIAFALVLFIPAALSLETGKDGFLPLLPFLSILSAREIGRRFASAARLWTLDQGLIALIFLLMLLLVATPLTLRDVQVDPEEDLARTAGRLAPEGQALGNFRFGSGTRIVRAMFYSGRRVDPQANDPAEVARICGAEPGKVFLCRAGDFRELHETDFHYRLNILYRAGDLIVFDLGEDRGPQMSPVEEDGR